MLCATSKGMESKDQFQLLPGTKKRLGIKVPGENRFLYIGSAILGAVLVTSFALTRYDNDLRAQITDLNDQISAVDQKRDKKGEENLKIAKQQIEVTENLIKDHLYWTKGLSKVASLVQSDIQLVSFVDQGTDDVNIKALAGSYTALAKQIASFVYDDAIKDVSVSRISQSVTGSLEFDLKLTVDISKFIKQQPEQPDEQNR